MANISKLIAASEKVQLPKQDSYTLSSNRLYFLTQAAIAAMVVVFTQMSNNEFYSVYTIFISIGAAIYALAAIFCAFTSNVTFDEKGITMPGRCPFMKEKLMWDDVNRAELTGVITYRSIVEKILKTMLSSIFASVELHVNYKNVPGGAKADFPVFSRVGSKATALYIIREKLGSRFTVYQGEY